MDVNGWTLYWHPAFKKQFQNLLASVEGVAEKHPDHFFENGHAKLLRRIVELIEEEIPSEPGHANYIQGKTLGAANTHWRRAKFLGRFRLFFRFSSSAKIIICAWVNDENSLRQAGGRNDPYVIFEKMLKSGNPPTGWSELLEAASEVAEIPKNLF